jgi:hypothetical protein
MMFKALVIAALLVPSVALAQAYKPDTRREMRPYDDPQPTNYKDQSFLGVPHTCLGAGCAPTDPNKRVLFNYSTGNNAPR